MRSWEERKNRSVQFQGEHLSKTAMVLVDTAVWILHFRHGDPQLKDLLMNGQVVCHPFIVGELACGNLQNREEILTLLRSLPMAITADHDEILRFIEMHRLMGKDLGYVDVHLLASVLLSGIEFWTKDRNLEKAARKLYISY